MKKLILLALPLLTVQTTLAAVRPVKLRIVPSSAVMFYPTHLTLDKESDILPLTEVARSLYPKLLRQGPLVALPGDGNVLFIPQTIRTGAQAMVLPYEATADNKEGHQILKITQRAARSLEKALSKGDGDSAYQILGLSFDGSKLGTQSMSMDSAKQAPEKKPEVSRRERQWLRKEVFPSGRLSSHYSSYPYPLSRLNLRKGSGIEKAYYKEKSGLVDDVNVYSLISPDYRPIYVFEKLYFSPNGSKLMFLGYSVFDGKGKKIMSLPRVEYY